MTPVRLEPAASRSRVKHSTTEPLRSLNPIILDYPIHIGVICMESSFMYLRSSIKCVSGPANSADYDEMPPSQIQNTCV